MVDGGGPDALGARRRLGLGTTGAEVRLRPNVSRYDSALIRRLYEGSSLEIGTDRVRWVAPDRGKYARGSFDIPVGSEPGQAHAVTHVRTTAPTTNEHFVDRYVVTDSTGRVLGSFPSGFGRTGSAAPEHWVGWYPQDAVQAATRDAGLEWADRDFAGDGRGLERAFPGAVSRLGQTRVLMWGLSLMMAAFTLWGMALLWQHARQDSMGVGRRVLLTILLGAYGLSVAVLASPRVWQRLPTGLRNVTARRAPPADGHEQATESVAPD